MDKEEQYRKEYEVAEREWGITPEEMTYEEFVGLREDGWGIEAIGIWGRNLLQKVEDRLEKYDKEDKEDVRETIMREVDELAKDIKETVETKVSAFFDVEGHIHPYSTESRKEEGGEG